MNLEVSIPFLQGTWNAPASKSELIRAIALAMQCEHTSILKNVSYSADVWTMLHLAETWGAKIKILPSSLEITGCKEPLSDTYLCNESALCLRLLLPILATHRGTFTLYAEGSLLTRPVGELESIITLLGGTIETNQGYPPVTITRPVHSGTVTVRQPISSQGISGLLMALPLLKGDSQINIQQPVSIPYLQLSLKFLNMVGINIHEDKTFSSFIIPGEQVIQPLNVSVEGDWSSASLIMVAATISGNVNVQNLDMDSLQPDKHIVDFLSIHKSKTFHIKSSRKRQGIEADITHCPDLFPALVLWASHAHSSSKIDGIHRLSYKESNRLQTFIQEFGKLGTAFNIENDTLYIHPFTTFNAAIIDSHNDHRLAMACALAATGTRQKVIIQHAECVSKSYSSFWDDIKCLGANIVATEK